MDGGTLEHDVKAADLRRWQWLAAVERDRLVRLPASGALPTVPMQMPAGRGVWTWTRWVGNWATSTGS